MDSLTSNVNDIVISEDVAKSSSPNTTIDHDVLPTSIHNVSQVSIDLGTSNQNAAPHEVAILKLELHNLKGKMNAYQKKMNASQSTLVAKLNSLEKQLSGKSVVEEHLKVAIQEANSEISRYQNILATKEKDLAEKVEYISILEKRSERNKIISENMVNELKATIIEQDEVIHSLEEKCLTQANENLKEIEKFRSEKFNISIKLQEHVEEIEELKEKLQYNAAAATHYATMDKKLREAELFIEDKSSENSQALHQIDTLNKNVQMLKNENSELVRRINQTRNELKVTQIRYEKLEKAFAESIHKIMTNRDEDNK